MAGATWIVWCSFMLKSGIVECQWKGERQECRVEDDFLYDYEVSSYLTLRIPKVTKENAGKYSCWHASSDTDQQKICSLDIADNGQEENVQSPDQSFKTLVIVLPVGLTVLAALVTGAVVFLLKYKRRILHLHTQRMEEPDGEEGQPMLELACVRGYLEANALDDPTELCLCADQLSDCNTPWDVSHTVVSKMLGCWKWNVTHAENAALTKELYVKLIARFFGPATLSSLRVPQDYEHFSLPKTLPETVSVTGDLFARLVLSPDLIALLDEPRAVLSGPPNSGKTTLLSLAGGKWLSSGHDVVDIKEESSGNVFFLLLILKDLKVKHNNEESSDVTLGYVYEYEFSFNSRKSIEKCIENMVKRKTNNFPCVLIDKSTHKRQRATEFCDILLNQIPDTRCLAICSKSRKSPETGHGRRLTDVLLSPPSVLREVTEVKVDSPTHVKANGTNTYPPPTDGPPVKHIYHKLSGILWSHEPQDCLECGSEVGSFLAKSLLVAGKDKAAEETHTDEVKMEEISKGTLEGASARQASRRALQFRDILSVFEFSTTGGQPNVKDDCNFLKGLRESGIMMRTVTDRNTDDLDDEDSAVALAVYIVDIKTWMTKRKIVVYIESQLWADYADRRRRALLSCTSQLIWVHPEKANTLRSSLLASRT